MLPGGPSSEVNCLKNENAMYLYIPIGLPGCGKSIWLAKQGIETIISPDIIRATVYGGYPTGGLDRELEKEVWKRAYALLPLAFETKMNVAFDATNLSKSRRKAILSKKDPEYKAVGVYFSTSLEECIKRQKGRKKEVSESVIRSMNTRLEFPEKEEGFDLLILGS